MEGVTDPNAYALTCISLPWRRSAIQRRRSRREHASLPNRRGPGIGWLEDATVQISQLLVRSGKDGTQLAGREPALVALVPDQYACSFGASRS
jgi:hypothetical protein